MLPAQRQCCCCFFTCSQSYWETYDLSVYYFSLLVELDAAPCSAWCDERCKELCCVPAASWIWLSQACFSFWHFRWTNVLFFWPLHGHAGAIDKQHDAGSTSKDAAFQAKRNMGSGWWLRIVFDCGEMTVTQNWVWLENGCRGMPGSHSSSPCCEAHVSSGWVEDMLVCIYVRHEHSWPSVVLIHI